MSRRQSSMDDHRPWPAKVAPTGAALAAAILLIAVWGLVVFNGCPDLLYNDEGLYMGWMAKSLLNRFVSDPFEIQYKPNQGGSVIFSLLLVPIYHLLGDSLLHLAFGSILFQGAIMASLVALCLRVWGPRAALWAGLLLLCAPMPYLRRSILALANHCEVPLFGLLNALLLWRIFKSWEEKEVTSPRIGILFGIVNGLGVYFHYDHGSVIAADLIILFLLHAKRSTRPEKASIPVFRMIAGFCIGISPLVYHSLRYSSLEVMSINDMPLWNSFDISFSLTKAIGLWDIFKEATAMNIVIDTDGFEVAYAIPEAAFRILALGTFATFPVAVTIGFAVLAISRFLRPGFSATRGLEVWCVLYLFIHLAACWTFEGTLHRAYMFPLFPFFCAMGGAVTANRACRLHAALRWLPPAFKAAFGVAILSLALLQWHTIYKYHLCIGESASSYRGFSAHNPGFFADPIARIAADRCNSKLTPPLPIAKVLSPIHTFEQVKEKWDLLSSELHTDEKELEPFGLSLLFRMGEMAGYMDLAMGDIRRALDPAIPDKYRHFFYMGLTNFLRYCGPEEIGRALESPTTTDPGYRHYFSLAYGACLGLRYRAEPETILDFVGNRAGADMEYVTAGILWTPASRNSAVASLAKILPEPVRGVILCEHLGSCSSPFGIGVEAMKNSLEQTTGEIDWNRLSNDIEGTSLPAVSGYGAGAALALVQPWRIPQAKRDLNLLPEEFRAEFARGFSEAASWLFGKDSVPLTHFSPLVF